LPHSIGESKSITYQNNKSAENTPIRMIKIIILIGVFFVMSLLKSVEEAVNSNFSVVLSIGTEIASSYHHEAKGEVSNERKSRMDS
jgi:hypothetical protein